LVALGVGHLLTFVASSAQPDAATRAALAGLEDVAVALPGPRHTLGDLFTGYSLMMALLLAAVGSLLLLMARHATQAPQLLVAALMVSLIVAAIGLVLSGLFLPLPPLVGLTVVLVAGVAGLLFSRRPTR
jgi:hypothetical protein